MAADARGSIAGVTFSRNRAGAYAGRASNPMTHPANAAPKPGTA